MGLLLDIFGFLSVILRGAVLAAQSFAIGGIVFLALLGRDAHVARRNVVPLILQTFLQPMMFVFIFGRVMVSSGYMPPAYKSLLLPGIEITTLQYREVRVAVPVFTACFLAAAALGKLRAREPQYATG